MPCNFLQFGDATFSNSRLQLSVILFYNKHTPDSQEVVWVDFHNPDTISYEQPLDMIPASMERSSISEAAPMKLSVGRFLLTIPNGTDPQLLAQTLRIVKELEC